MNVSTHSDTTFATTAPIALWRIAEAFMHNLFGLFGAPEEVAASEVLLTKPYRQMCTWLRVAEALMRRLLLIEAAAFPKPNDLPRPHAKRVRKTRLVEFFPDKPQDWRVSFRCFSSPARGGSAERSEAKGDVVALSSTSPSVGCADTSPARGGGLKRFHSAWPLALRLQALLRVYNDPLPYARRLARRLHAAAHRARDLFRAPPDAHHKIGDVELAALDDACETAMAAFNSS